VNGVNASHPDWSVQLAYFRPGEILITAGFSWMFGSLMPVFDIVQNLEKRRFA
jgi:hypothetical protein